MKMKRFVCASLILTLGTVLLPLIFPGGSVSAADSPVSPSPSQYLSPESPGEIDGSLPSPAFSDNEKTLSVLIGDNVVEMTMAEYLPWAVAAEMPVSFHEEAMKAQTVAARTYALYCTLHENPDHPQADLCSNSGCCMAYLDEASLRGRWGSDYEQNLALVKDYVSDTDGQVLTYDSLPILACFHSSSAGMTEQGRELWGDVPYLEAVVSPETEQDVPNYISTLEVTPQELKENLLRLCPEAALESDPALWIESTELSESGRVSSITIGGASFTGSQMRGLFSLRSTAFSLEYINGCFLFTVTGYGHGLGMSQYGADVMAQKGFTWKEILMHYYTGATLS